LERVDFPFIVAVDCSVFPASDPTNLALWQAIVETNCSAVRISPAGRGTRIEPEAQSAVLDICSGQETAIDYNSRIEFVSEKTDAETYTNIDFFDYLFGANGNNKNLVYMYMTCDGVWYAITQPTAVRYIDRPWSSGNRNYREIGGAVLYTTYGPEKPLGRIPGLEQLLLNYQAEECGSGTTPEGIETLLPVGQPEGQDQTTPFLGFLFTRTSCALDVEVTVELDSTLTGAGVTASIYRMDVDLGSPDPADLLGTVDTGLGTVPGTQSGFMVILSGTTTNTGSYTVTVSGCGNNPLVLTQPVNIA
jgi:hypothetical protein